MKKRKGGGGANWQDTYGDMVTLLLCFFVLLYSMSTISEENWKALVMSFNPDAVQTPTATSGGSGPNADPEGDNEGGDISQEEIDSQIEALYLALKDYVAAQSAEGTISVTKGDGIVYVCFNQSVFFEPDKADLIPNSIEVLDVVSGMLNDAAQAIDEIRIMGHTAQAETNRPNYVEEDRSLSSQRATNVLIYLQENTTLDPARLISEGYGQWRPIADNTTAEGRRQNRRVEMVISGRNLETELMEGIQHYDTSYTGSTLDDLDSEGT